MKYTWSASETEEQLYLKLVHNSQKKHENIIPAGITCKKILLLKSIEFGIPLK